MGQVSQHGPRSLHTAYTPVRGNFPTSEVTVALKELTAGCLADVIKLVLSAGSAKSHWYRGQGCEHSQLKSSLRRRLPTHDPSQLLSVEFRLITRWRQRSLPFWPEGYPQNDWEHLFAMQHFGVPTRLLDWSENILVAAFFASARGTCQAPQEPGLCRPTLWILDPVSLNQHTDRLSDMNVGVLATSDEILRPWAPGVGLQLFAPWPVAIYGTHNSSRMVAQQGTFTVDGKQNGPLEAAPAVTGSEPVLTKMTIACTHEQLQSDLHKLGLTQATVFPGLDGLALDLIQAELP